MGDSERGSYDVKYDAKCDGAKTAVMVTMMTC